MVGLMCCVHHSPPLNLLQAPAPTPEAPKAEVAKEDQMEVDKVRHAPPWKPSMEFGTAENGVGLVMQQMELSFFSFKGLCRGSIVPQLGGRQCWDICSCDSNNKLAA